MAGNLEVPMITDSATFCSVPWTSLNIDQTGKVLPCMLSGFELGNIKQQSLQSVMTGSRLRDLRTTMQRGEWHGACDTCRQSEQTTGVSARMHRVTDAETLAQIDTNADFFRLTDLVINWSNLCNLTCTYCNADTSTAWQAALHLPIKLINNEHDDLIALAQSQGINIRGLTLGGGEPLLQKRLPEFLSYLDPAQTRVLVTTNLSVDIKHNPVYAVLRHWPNVEWQISFDNANPGKFEFVRRGASWQQFLTNIDVMQQDQQLIKAHPAYSIYCAYDLAELYEFVTDRNLDLFWCELTYPWDLDVRRLTAAMRELAVAEIDAVSRHYAGNRCLALDTLQRYRTTLLDPSYLVQPDYRCDPVGFHDRLHNTLPHPHVFRELWSDVVNNLGRFHYV